MLQSLAATASRLPAGEKTALVTPSSTSTAHTMAEAGCSVGFAGGKVAAAGADPPLLSKRSEDARAAAEEGGGVQGSSGLWH